MFTISCLSWIDNTGVLSLWFRKFSYTEMWIMLYLLEIFPTDSLSEMLDATWSKTLSLCFWKVFVSKSSSFYMSLQKSSFFCMLNLLHTSPHVIITSRFNKQTLFFFSRLLMRTLSGTWAASQGTHMLQPFHSDSESLIIVLWYSSPNKSWSPLTLLSNQISLSCLQVVTGDNTKKTWGKKCDICCLIVIIGS